VRGSAGDGDGQTSPIVGENQPLDVRHHGCILAVVVVLGVVPKTSAAAWGRAMKVVPLNEVKNRLSTYYLFESDPRFIARIEALRRAYRAEGGATLASVRKELRVRRPSKPAAP
jgi:hypothetical protein